MWSGLLIVYTLSLHDSLLLLLLLLSFSTRYNRPPRICHLTRFFGAITLANSKKETTGKLNYVHAPYTHSPDVWMGWCDHRMCTYSKKWQRCAENTAPHFVDWRFAAAFESSMYSMEGVNTVCMHISMEILLIMIYDLWCRNDFKLKDHRYGTPNIKCYCCSYDYGIRYTWMLARLCVCFDVDAGNRPMHIIVTHVYYYVITEGIDLIFCISFAQVWAPVDAYVNENCVTVYRYYFYFLVCIMTFMWCNSDSQWNERLTNNGIN